MAATDFKVWGAFHDPDADERFMFQLQLDSGVTLVSAQVDVVNDTSSAVDGATDLVISDTQSGLIAGNLWGVSFRCRGGSTLANNAPKEYFVRCRYTLSDSPHTGDRTMRIRVKQL